MKPEKPIYGEESEELEKKISKLISRHNILCKIEEVFTNNKTANEYFKAAQEEVISLGSYILEFMFAMAIEEMICDIEVYEKEEKNEPSLRYRIRELEKENQLLKSQLGQLKNIFDNLQKSQ